MKTFPLVSGDELVARLCYALKKRGAGGMSCCELAAEAREFRPCWGNDARYGGKLGHVLAKRGLARPFRDNPRQLRFRAT